MSDSFDSLGLAPWIVRQVKTLGKHWHGNLIHSNHKIKIKLTF